MLSRYRTNFDSFVEALEQPFSDEILFVPDQKTSDFENTEEVQHLNQRAPSETAPAALAGAATPATHHQEANTVPPPPRFHHHTHLHCLRRLPTYSPSLAEILIRPTYTTTMLSLVCQRPPYGAGYYKRCLAQIVRNFSSLATQEKTILNSCTY